MILASSPRIGVLRCLATPSPFKRSSGSARFSNQAQLKEDFDYCVNLVRERDREGFYCGLLMPSDSQKPFFALRAFNVELASIKEGHNIRRGGGSIGMSETPTVALRFRMQWWKDALKEIYGDKVPGSKDPSLANLSISYWNSPVVRALHAAHQKIGFTRRFLERLIEARETDLEVNQFGTMNELSSYAEESVSSLLYLSLECTGVREDDSDLVASHAGVGIGLATAIRSTPFRLLHGEIPLPSELFTPTYPYHRLPDELFGNSDGQGDGDDGDTIMLSEDDKTMLVDAVRFVAMTASSHLAEARDLQGKVPKIGRPALLPVVPALNYLSRLEQANFRLQDPRVQEYPRLTILLLLGRTWLTGIF